MTTPSKATVTLMAFVVFVDMLGLGLILPVMPSLIVELTGESLDQAAEIGGLLIFCYAGMQFLFAPFIAGLSDRFGRRPVLLTTLFLLGVDYCMSPVSAYGTDWRLKFRSVLVLVVVTKERR